MVRKVYAQEKDFLKIKLFMRLKRNYAKWKNS